MKKMDKDGILLCELQAKTFELSLKLTETSSEIFIRRFMNSDVAKMLDNTSILETNLQPQDIIESIQEQYGVSHYGSVKYTENEMYWIGYLYRFFAYTYELQSRRVYKIVISKELRGLFLPYYTLDPAQALERILEAKGLCFDEESELRRQYEIYKRIREND